MINHRDDIDGLRAIAVLAVIFFHMNYNWLPGGFVGVDIFFVISGYLITSIIYREIDAGKFSFKNFYLRRIRRILPAFFLVLIISILFGFFVMLPSHFYDLCIAAFAAVIFCANTYYTMFVDRGYFHPISEIPLLNTWSLSVEEQYYLIWPVILLFLFKLKLKYKHLLFLCIIFMVISFITANILASSPVFFNNAYFSLYTRAGELLIGCIIALLHIRQNSDNLKYTQFSSIIGIFFIVLSFFILNKDSIFPGFNALFPTLGSGLIIYGNQNSIVNKFLAQKPLVYIGLISYSLYLWHGPVLSFLDYIYPVENKSINTIILLTAGILIFILSILSYKFIEKPARQLKLNFSRSILYYAVIPTCIFSLICSICVLNIPNHFNQKINEYLLFSKMNSGFIRPNKQNNTNLFPALVYGDSHAMFFGDFLHKICQKDNKLAFDMFTGEGCEPAIDTSFLPTAKTACKKLKNTFNSSIGRYNTIILAARWDLAMFPINENENIYTINYINKLTKLVEDLVKKGKKVIIFSQVPEYNIDVNRNEFITKRLGFNFKYKIDKEYKMANERIEEAVKNYKNVYFINFDKFLCPNGICTPYDKDNLIMYYDDDHLNAHGSEILADRFLTSKEYIKFKSFLYNN